MSFSIEDQLTWRVTDEFPIRKQDGMDWERCAALHNLIVELGWTASGNAVAAMPIMTWWEKYINHESLEEEWTTLLSPSLKLILQSALETPRNGQFFFYAAGLTVPSYFYNVSDEDRILSLYMMSCWNQSGHPYGSIRCNILSRYTGFSYRHEWPHGWDPLEVILTAWLAMIDTGKVIAILSGTEIERPPWHMVPYSKYDLAIAVNSFDDLVTRMECLLEDPTLQPLDNVDEQTRLLEACAVKLEENDPSKLGLLSEEFLDRAEIPEGFTRSFLIQVRRPSSDQIKYIAPGLRLPVPSDYSPHPFQGFQNPRKHPDYEKNVILQLPLFISDTKSSEALFGYPYHEHKNLSCGLWTESCDRDMDHIFEDTCRLSLPFEIGAKGFARRKDDSFVGEEQWRNDTKGNACKDDLYQPGYNHFVEKHGPQLGNVMRQWFDMVGLGHWEVIEEGVLGGIEKFKEADTEERYHLYQIFTRW